MYESMRVTVFRHRNVFKLTPLLTSHEFEECALKQQAFKIIRRLVHGTLLRNVPHPNVYMLIADEIDEKEVSSRHTARWFVDADAFTTLRCPVCGQTDSGFLGKASADAKFSHNGGIVGSSGVMDADYTKPLRCIRCDYEAHASKFDMGSWKQISPIAWDEMLESSLI